MIHKSLLSPTGAYVALSPRRKRVIHISFAVLLLFMILCMVPSERVKQAITHHAEANRWSVPLKLMSSSDQKIANGTLGFGAIFALGLPDRYDKRDAMELAAGLTDIQITWMDGIPGDTMNPKAVPPAHSDPKSKDLKLDGEVGCWRGHMNIIERIVKEGLSSALILEDDADWDVHIVQQMQQFSTATKDMLSEDAPRVRRPYTGSPYGEGWDILWIGHCGGWPSHGKQNSTAIIHDDDTVPPYHDIDDMLRNVGAGSKAPCSAHLGRDPKGKVCDSPRLATNERLVQEKTSPLCTTGYAVSQQGARKMLARIGGISLLDVVAPIDTEMTKMCRGQDDRASDRRESTKCLSVVPPYIKSHRPRGRMSGDSDINKVGGEGQVREVGLSRGLVWSTRLNVENLVGGFEPESQYVNDGKGWRYKRRDEYRAYGPRK